MTVHLPRKVYGAMSVHAADAYPYECCGYITGTDDPRTWQVHPCRNIQNELHERDPVQHPRDARTAYMFSPEDMERLFYGTFEPPEARVIGFYHSHPDHPAYFSEKDRMEALTDWLQPEPFYLVISVLQGTVRDMKTFQWVEEKQTFDELHVEVDE
jgi:proteasome lid subunit RPN8/RPN11